jgi:hypothetical protein
MASKEMQEFLDGLRMADLDFDAIKRDYERDGFMVLPGYLSETEVSELRDRAIPLADAIMKKEGNSGKFRNLLKSLHRHDDWFDRPEGETQGLGPHVDALGRDKEPDAGATIWFALDSANVGNGCLHYLRGSQRNSYPDEIPIPGIDTESKDAFAAELEPGDAVIHNALTVHWSGGNTTGLPRRAVSYFYFSARVHAALQQRKMA